MASILPNPEYYQVTFFSNCEILAVGCCVKYWNGTNYVDADDIATGYLSDGTYCYKIEDCIITSVSLCVQDLYVHICAVESADNTGQVRVYGYIKSSVSGSSPDIPPNVPVTVSFTITGNSTTKTGTLTIDSGFIYNPIYSSVIVSGFNPFEGIVDLQMTSINVPPSPANPTGAGNLGASTTFPLNTFRRYFIGSVCLLSVPDPPPLPPVVQCLDGLTIEAIYIHPTESGFPLPSGYTNPCPNITHVCNKAFFEIYGNGVFLGDARMNNLDGEGGAVRTPTGTKEICRDYNNTPNNLKPSNQQQPHPWGFSRYDKILLSSTKAKAVADAGNGSQITLTLKAAMVTYNRSCYGNPDPHTDVTWIRVTNKIGQVIYNGCPQRVSKDFVATIDVCQVVNNDS